MDAVKIEIRILPHTFLLEDGTFNKEEALLHSGRIGGICYSLDGYEKLKDEPIKTTQKRVKMTLELGHHSVYDHIYINFDIRKIPKILAMILNNEKQYNTSERSFRYTPILQADGVSDYEKELYQKWFEILKEKITERHGDVWKKNKIEKVAQEKARSFLTVFLPTAFIYSTTIRQINYLVAMMKKYIEEESNKNNFTKRLGTSMQEFIDEITKLNVLDDALLLNEKQRKLAFFNENIEERQEYFGDVYSTSYKISYDCFADSQRHRTISYEMKRPMKTEYYIPPLIEKDKKLAEEWIKDIQTVADLFPIGELVLVNERGTYENFILKTKDRLCSAVQLDVMKQTKATLTKYTQGLEKNNHPLKDDIKNYTKGARCTFPDYKCAAHCHFKEGIDLTRES